MNKKDNFEFVVGKIFFNLLLTIFDVHESEKIIGAQTQRQSTTLSVNQPTNQRNINNTRHIHSQNIQL